MPRVPTRPMPYTYSPHSPHGLPRDLVRSYNTRVNGIFKKAAELHKLFDGEISVSIVVQKPRATPWLFNTGEHGLDWPEDVSALV